MAVTVSISEYCLFHQVYNRPLSWTITSAQ
jgi:hypothetical protein